MQPKKINEVSENFDWQDILYYMSLSAKEKLEYLEQMNLFFEKIKPKSSKDSWEMLKKSGF